MQNFNLHQHTYRCGHADVDIKDEDYIEEYLKAGFNKIAFTDHCPEKDVIDKRPNIRMTYEKRNEYLESINRLKDKYKNKIEILSGYEIEFLPGQEKNLEELKNESDILILGQHFVYADDGKDLNVIGWNSCTDKDLFKYGEYVKNAIEKGLPDIIAHPDFFMLGRKSFGDYEENVTREICKAASKYGIPLEINLNNIFRHEFYDLKDKKALNKSNSTYPNKDFWKIVSEYNIKTLYGLDVHHIVQISLYKELAKLANNIIGKETIEKLEFVNNF